MKRKRCKEVYDFIYLPCKIWCKCPTSLIYMYDDQIINFLSKEPYCDRCNNKLCYGKILNGKTLCKTCFKISTSEFDVINYIRKREIGFSRAK